MAHQRQTGSRHRGHSNPLMFSTIPMIGTSLSLQNVTDLRESSKATSCGVVTITAPLTLPSRSMVVTDSLPVPGGKSTNTKFRSCHSTPPKSWLMNSYLYASRQMIGSSEFCNKKDIEAILRLYA